jgi:hypothetical protein
MPIPSDGRMLWFGANAAIPANWSRDTNFDDRFLQGVSGDTAGTNSGSGHTHSQSHTHAGNIHGHTWTLGSITGSTRSATFGSSNYSAVTHSHNLINTDEVAATYQSNTTATDSTDMKPSYTTAIIISPDDASQDAPSDSVGFFDTSQVHSLWHKCDGTSGTPNLTDKFILGADTGNDGNGTGGSATHDHNMSANHTHGVNTHDHGESDSGTTPETRVRAQTAAGLTALLPIHHHQDWNLVAGDPTSSEDVTIDTASSEPSYKKLFAIQNESISARLDNGLIIPYVGTRANIPSDWWECDGTNNTLDLQDYQIKVTNTVSEIGNTGGSDSHTHTTQSHNHTITGSHSHGGSGSRINTLNPSSGAISVLGNVKHSHASTMSQETPTMQANDFTTASSDGRYNYREVLFIKYMHVAVDIIGLTDVIGETDPAAIN